MTQLVLTLILYVSLLFVSTLPNVDHSEQPLGCDTENKDYSINSILHHMLVFNILVHVHVQAFKCTGQSKNSRKGLFLKTFNFSILIFSVMTHFTVIDCSLTIKQKSLLFQQY